MTRRGLLCVQILSVVISIMAIPAAAQQRVWIETGEPVSGWEFVDEVSGKIRSPIWGSWIWDIISLKW